MKTAPRYRAPSSRLQSSRPTNCGSAPWTRLSCFRPVQRAVRASRPSPPMLETRRYPRLSTAPDVLSGPALNPAVQSNMGYLPMGSPERATWAVQRAAASVRTAFVTLRSMRMARSGSRRPSVFSAISLGHGMSLTSATTFCPYTICSLAQMEICGLPRAAKACSVTCKTRASLPAICRMSRASRAKPSMTSPRVRRASFGQPRTRAPHILNRISGDATRHCFRSPVPLSVQSPQTIVARGWERQRAWLATTSGKTPCNGKP